jgi:hypothetical protein
LVLKYCQLMNREYEFISINRDTTEGDLKQVRFFVRSFLAKKKKKPYTNFTFEFLFALFGIFLKCVLILTNRIYLKFILATRNFRKIRAFREPMCCERCHKRKVFDY